MRTSAYPHNGVFKDYDEAFVEAVEMANRLHRPVELQKNNVWGGYTVSLFVIDPKSGTPMEAVHGEVIRPGTPLTSRQREVQKSRQASLAHQVARIAHDHPETREHLLPLLKEAKQDADTQYKVRLREVRGQLGQIERLISEHEKMQSVESLNWGYVGDLGYVAEELGNVVSFLKNEDH